MKPTDARNNADLLQALEAGARPKYVYFWGHRPRRQGEIDKSCFSQWFPAPFQVEGTTYLTAEHYMMAEKARLFGDSEIQAKIIAAGNPGEAKKLGRKVRGFDNAAWEEHRFKIVVTGNVEKFRRHPAMGGFLLGTGDRVLVEASPVDAVWGIGLAADDSAATTPAGWKGLNLLGYALMEVRARLKG